MTGCPGKWPGKNGSLMLTFFIPINTSSLIEVTDQSLQMEIDGVKHQELALYQAQFHLGERLIYDLFVPFFVRFFLKRLSNLGRKISIQRMTGANSYNMSSD